MTLLGAKESQKVPKMDHFERLGLSQHIANFHLWQMFFWHINHDGHRCLISFREIWTSQKYRRHCNVQSLLVGEVYHRTKSNICRRMQYDYKRFWFKDWHVHPCCRLSSFSHSFGRIKISCFNSFVWNQQRSREVSLKGFIHWCRGFWNGTMRQW